MAQFLFYPLFLRLFVSLSLSRLSWSKKPPAPFCFFFDFFPSFGRDHGSSVKRQSSPATGSKKKKNQDDSFFGLVFKARLCHHQQILSFSDCARKSSIATKKTTYSHTRYNSKEKCLSQFPPLLAPESSPRRTSAPLPPREEPPRCKSSRKENYGGFAMFFFNTKIASASARARVLEH